MRIQANGNVGIGTAVPGYKLHVVDSSATGVAGCFNETGTNTYNYGTISYATGAGTNNYAVYGEASGASGHNFGGYFVGKGYFSGNVGIGTTAQAAKLAINGGLHVGGDTDPGDNNLLVDGNIGIGIASTARVHIAAGSATASTGPLKLTSGALLGTPETGSIEFYDGRFYLTGRALQRAIDRTGSVITASVDAVGTAETTLFSTTLSAGAAKVGRIYKLHCDGVIKNKASTDDVTFIFYRGATVLATVTPTGKTYAVGTGWHIDFNQTIRTVGGAGTLAQHGHIVIGGTDTAFQSLLAGIDFTIADTLTIKAKWSDNLDQAENVVTIYQGYLELKN
jgi:hypothetical protein